MRSEEARIGARVRVSESGRSPELRGLTGTISGKWGNPEYLALDVQLDEGACSCSGTTSWKRSDGRGA
jgi:hypothetical protein